MDTAALNLFACVCVWVCVCWCVCGLKVDCDVVDDDDEDDGDADDFAGDAGKWPANSSANKVNQWLSPCKDFIAIKCRLTADSTCFWPPPTTTDYHQLRQ